MSPRGAALVIASALTFGAWRAGACSFPGLIPHAIDDALADDVPPEPPQDVSVTVFRGRAPDSGGCESSNSVTSCDDTGGVALTLNEPATDDQTSAEKMGYLVELSDGTLPGGLTLPSTAVRTSGDNMLELIFNDDATEGQEVVAFSITLTPVDEAGNVGTSSAPIRVYDSGSAEGCRVTRRAPSLDVALLIGLFAVARRMAKR